jgi:hypothetical protein
VLKARPDPGSAEEAVHEAVRSTWELARGWTDMEMGAEVKDRLWRATRGGCLPETRMLLMLLPFRCQGAEEDVAQAASSWLQKVKLGSPRHHRNLTVFPLYRRGVKAEGPGYEVLEEALQRGSFQVTEVSEGGEVPRLAVQNGGSSPVLVPEGSILVGAKQNRVIDVTILVAAQSQVVVPVSCVEQGRWSYRSQSFGVMGHAHPTLRGIKEASRRHAREMHGEERTDQGAVWGEVSECLADVGARSETGDLTQGLESLEERIEEYRKRLRLSKRTIGVLVASGERVLGLDLFGHPEVCKKVWARIQEGYVLEAARNENISDPTGPDKAEVFLRGLELENQRRREAMGLGQALAIGGNGAVGAGLWHQGEMVHLSAFPA